MESGDHFLVLLNNRQGQPKAGEGDTVAVTISLALDERLALI